MLIVNFFLGLENYFRTFCSLLTCPIDSRMMWKEAACFCSFEKQVLLDLAPCKVKVLFRLSILFFQMLLSLSTSAHYSTFPHKRNSCSLIHSWFLLQASVGCIFKLDSVTATSRGRGWAKILIME